MTKITFSNMEEKKKERCDNRLKEINQLVYNSYTAIGEMKDIEAYRLKKLINPDETDDSWQNQNNA